MMFGVATFKDIKPEVQSLLKAMGYEDDLRGVTHVAFDLPFNGVPKVTISRIAKHPEPTVANCSDVWRCTCTSPAGSEHDAACPATSRLR